MSELVPTSRTLAALDLEHEHGRIAVGRRANLVILDAPSYTLLPYRMGTNLVHTVLVLGRFVVRNRRLVRD